MAYLKLDHDDIKELAAEIARLLKPEGKEDDIIFLKDLAIKHHCSVQTLQKMRREKHIPKVEGWRQTAIKSKYLSELFR